ncbi:QDE-2-interacting [Fusarium beomiforme]|uniref:QDE-2-interacting n=1 Tax=Fusarium beomiforme TaxID=44412 RepID=A0A9P5DWJ3_9HYPO|nr:QDE-2-interacting [Fusarium beomiforme]
MRDVKLICIDADNIVREPGQGDGKKQIKSFHLGVAILDTRDIRDVVNRQYKLDTPSDLIQTYQFAVEDSVPQVEHFYFGDTEAIFAQDLKAKVVAWQEGRDIVSVAYSAHHDLFILKDFGIYLNHAFCIDLAQAQYIPFQSAIVLSLAVIMNRLSIRYHGRLHIQGNDAHYTLRTLLGLAALDFYRE